MEFNFRGDDLKTTSFQFFSPIHCHFSGPSTLRGGFPNTEQMLNRNVAGEDMLLKLEKERIRREIISGEIWRRRMLEEEVRREMLLEREAAFQRSLGEKFLLDEQMAIGLNPRLDAIPLYDNRPLEERIAFPQSKQTVPQVKQSVEPQIQPSPKINTDKLIMLAKPNPDIYDRAKRKAVIQDVDDDPEHSPVVVKKKPKDDWSCALCNVNVTSEKALNEHLQGKKHKSRESAQKRIQKIATSASSSLSTSKKQSPKPTETVSATSTSDMEAKADAQPEAIIIDANQTVEVKTDDEKIVEKIQKAEDSEKQNGTETEQQVRIAESMKIVEVKTDDEKIVEKIQKAEDSEKQNGTETEQQVRIAESMKKGFKFWCDLCHVGSFSVVVMENHKRGRKHTNRLKRSLQNDESAPPTSAAVPDATPLLTKDVGDCPNDD